MLGEFREKLKEVVREGDLLRGHHEELGKKWRAKFDDHIFTITKLIGEVEVEERVVTKGGFKKVAAQVECMEETLEQEKETLKDLKKKLSPACSFARLWKSKSVKVRTVGDLDIYQLPLKESIEDTTVIKELGYNEFTMVPKTILLLGEPGAGVLTHINSMGNYIMGVEYDDPFRLQLAPEGQRSEQVTVYKINHYKAMKVDYPLTIVHATGVTEDGEDPFLAHFANGKIETLSSIAYVVKYDGVMSREPRYWDGVQNFLQGMLGKDTQSVFSGHYTHFQGPLFYSILDKVVSGCFKFPYFHTFSGRIKF